MKGEIFPAGRGGPGVHGRQTIDQPNHTNPVLVAIDDDPDALARIEQELLKRYGADYRVVCESSPETGLKALRQLKAAGDEVAVALTDQWMPGMNGTEFLSRAHQLFPTARRALLVAPEDTTIREPLLQATALGQVDFYVSKPWRSPDESFHRLITEFLDECSSCKTRPRDAHRPFRLRPCSC